MKRHVLLKISYLYFDKLHLGKKKRSVGTAYVCFVLFLEINIAVEWNISPSAPNSYIETLPLNVIVFRDGAFEK